MSSSQVMLLAQKQATAMLIREEPTLIALIREGAWARTSGGGQKRLTGSVTLPGVLRWFSGVGRAAGPATASTNDVQRYSFQGELIVSDHVVVGPLTDDIQAGDEFLLGIRRFQVIFVHPNKSFEVRAEVRELS